jgi:type I restriction enzyme S subunit
MTSAPPGNWCECDLGSISLILDNLRVPLSAAQRSGRSGPYPYCGANGVLDHIDDFMIDDDVILLAEDGGNFDQYASRPIAYRMQGRIWVNNHAHVLKAGNGETEFLFYTLEHKDITPYISSGTRSKLTRGELVRIKVATPKSICEQRKIGATLRDADNLISALERLISKKQAIKQGMMQELLTGRTRLPGFDGEWNDVSLGSIATVTMGQSPAGITYNSDSYGIPLVQGNADIRDRATFDRVWTTAPTKLCKGGDIILTVRAPVGYTAIASRASCLGRGVCALSTKADNRFLFHALVYVEPSWALYEQGSTFTAVNSNEVRSFTLRWPADADERSAIAHVLDDADDELRILELRLGKARAIKQGMMQELLTGRTRLPVQEAVA